MGDVSGWRRRTRQKREAPTANGDVCVTGTGGRWRPCRDVSAHGLKERQKWWLSWSIWSARSVGPARPGARGCSCPCAPQQSRWSKHMELYGVVVRSIDRALFFRAVAMRWAWASNPNVHVWKKPGKVVEAPLSIVHTCVTHSHFFRPAPPRNRFAVRFSFPLSPDSFVRAQSFFRHFCRLFWRGTRCSPRNRATMWRNSGPHPLSSTPSTILRGAVK